METFINLGIALAIGLLIGLERGWRTREVEEGSRVAGFRTFGLISLLGALWSLVGQELGELVLGFAFLGFAALIITAHVLDAQADKDYGITTAVATLLTFVLGALAARGHLAIASSAAVISAILLGLKPQLHQFISHLEQREVFAVFKMLLISVVMLPILPDQGYGPWQSLNPYKIWLYVVLIALISFTGYFAIRTAGARLGLSLTALFAGLASSTAVTLSFSRLGQRLPKQHTLLAAGVVVAAGTMFPRMLLEVSVVNHDLLPLLTAPLLAMAAVSYIAFPLLLMMGKSAPQKVPMELTNPFEIVPALQFGALLAIIMLASRAFADWFGDTGIYVLSAASAISDVDAITLTLSKQAKELELAESVAVEGILLAAIVNTLVKGGMVVAFCGGRMGRLVSVVLLLACAIGIATYFLQPLG